MLRLTYKGDIHDDSLELYEDSIIYPDDSEPEYGLVDSSDSDDDNDSGTVTDDSNIMKAYHRNSDDGPYDEFEGLKPLREADYHPAVLIHQPVDTADSHPAVLIHQPAE